MPSSRLVFTAGLFALAGAVLATQQPIDCSQRLDAAPTVFRAAHTSTPMTLVVQELPFETAERQPAALTEKAMQGIGSRRSGKLIADSGRRTP